MTFLAFVEAYLLGSITLVELAYLMVSGRMDAFGVHTLHRSARICECNVRVMEAWPRVYGRKDGQEAINLLKRIAKTLREIPEDATDDECLEVLSTLLDESPEDAILKAI